MSTDMLEALGITVTILGVAGTVVTAARALGYLLRWFRWS